MEKSSTSNNKWKTGFLKTGLPLEYVTSNILDKLGHSIFGEYPYVRPNEKKELTEFSVDLRSYKCVDNNNKLIILSMLIECKYRQPGTSWVFSPYPNDLMPIGLINSTQDLVPMRLGHKAIFEFEKKIGYCVSGIELSNDGNGNTNGVKHGIFQLRFAIPHLLKKDLENCLERTYYDGNYIDLSCSILVTTAEIRVIKKDLQLTDFTNADNLDEVTEIKEAIILNETPGPQLQEFADSLANDFLKDHPEIEKRLLDIENVLVGKDWKNRVAPDLDTIQRSFGYSTERVLIINYEYLEKTLLNLETALKKDIEKEKIYGKIISDGEGFKIIKAD